MRIPSVYPDTMQQWIKIRTSLGLKALKEPFMKNKRLRLVDNSTVPIESMTNLVGNDVIKLARERAV